MPELPEVETVCRIMRRVLKGHKISEAEIPHDEIVLSGLTPKDIEKAVLGRTVKDVGRKGKFWWIEFEEPGPVLCGHLGMAGWIREMGVESGRLREHGKKPLDDEEGRPRFLKLLLTGAHGKRIAFTDGRRLGRLWLADKVVDDPRIAQLGPDAYNELPSVKELGALFGKRSAPIKAALLDQGMISGIGNYLADEVLYQSRIAPKRPAKSLKPKEIEHLREAILNVLQTVIDAEANFEKLPKDWLVHVRWDGKRGVADIGGEKIIRESVGSRTTAWVPSKQR